MKMGMGASNNKDEADCRTDDGWMGGRMADGRRSAGGQRRADAGWRADGGHLADGGQRRDRQRADRWKTAQSWNHFVLLPTGKGPS